MLARFNAYLADKRMMDLHEEEERPNSANVAEFICEDEGLEEVEEANEGDVIRFEDLEAAPTKLDDLKADIQDPLDEINLGSEEEPNPVYISQLLPEDVKERFTQLVKEFKCCFAWDYDEMPGLSRDLVEHRLPIQHGFRPFKQPPRRMSDEVQLQVKAEDREVAQGWFHPNGQAISWRYTSMTW
ncbi:hypothetical protein Vadar_020181 [Vaccinium darrowii]|uniref:Uncharacterized protein n=1 Tax=Vaccinium darrowii TaxID=229202 RepID=A0ACB7XIR3_9ERIC|nr:hypothetical protein Vadar_020181 [Vaccinium darrowii]